MNIARDRLIPRIWSRFSVAVLSAAVILATMLAVTARSEAAQIAAYPSPGTTLASPNSNIAFNGVTKAQIGRIVVRGSKTGVHPGRIRSFAGPVGVSFIPNRPFAPRERVTVTSTKHTFFGTGRRSFSFQTGLFLAENLGKPPFSPPKGQAPRQAQSYHTMPLQLPKITVHANKEGKAPGKMFYAPRTSGPTILDEDGNVVWYRPGLRVTDFRAQTYRGKPILTWWRRAPFGGRVTSKFEMADQNYRVFKRFSGGNGYTADPHEFKLTPRGTAYITAYRVAIVNLRKWGGPAKATLLDYISQEIDVQTGLVVWEWHPLSAMPITDSYVKVPKRNGRPYDWIHINSVNDDTDGNILISARHTQTLYKVNRRTGKVMWRIGGKRSSFKLGPGVKFAYQHDVQRQKDGTLSFFDNGAGGKHGKLYNFSTAKSLRVDQQKKQVTLVRSYRRGPNWLANSQGNVDVQPNGNLFVGWGSLNACTEFAPSGEVVFDFSFAAKTVSYRCYKSPWTGVPLGPVAVKSQKDGSGSKVWMSWNGDTRVKEWRVLAGGSRGQLEVVATVPRTGFESVADLDHSFQFYRVVGLSADGKVLGRSNVNPLGKLTK